ncbi:biotin--[acetyl-CoA-carboxylase] ligase [Actinomyces provencensis]|uniref:biotin--[acetyl-CoA-carboxylase] ligase n=1 Tax=Actinomyces provencensis TaxID=1720198 RepID=UPI0018A83875|nr:biotin--[acetyl-CoA-carboxylase] ligase [Actinomyces provencensis]
MHTTSNFERMDGRASSTPASHAPGRDPAGRTGSASEALVAASHVPLLVHVAAAESTNELARDLHRDARIDTPHQTLVVADHQTAGRGRLGRHWESPAGRSLTASVLLRVPATPGLRSALPWFALAAALAARDAVARRLTPLGRAVGVKWPNDVVVDGTRKVAGLLAELLEPTGTDLWMVIGLGVNVAMTSAERPTPVATSLSLEGDEDAGNDPARVVDSLLCDWVDALAVRAEALVDHDGDAVAAGVHAEISESCVTVGRQVSVRRPDDAGRSTPRSAGVGRATPGSPPTSPSLLTGTATAIGPDGALLVRPPGGATVAVTTGDVEMVAPT